MTWYGYGTYGYAGNFLAWQVPVYLLLFSILFIILAKLLNSALAAIPIAIIVTAATGAYVLAFASRLPLFFGDIIALILGYAIVAAVLYKMLYRI